ncbi:hypothetical protein NVV93_05080 [Pseudomonas sp. LS44]|uniref:hypothetical protein n=1 Tax=Pseudomonas sp. LS44 TaxID=1357074 RepID=UPI00215AAEC1|nr:hypothetical protein [Pseudomonas sp. LS44]UVE18766.1 hypothetical protein NVV93_05080 [Pseudomonas sp. LS44]
MLTLFDQATMPASAFSPVFRGSLMSLLLHVGAELLLCAVCAWAWYRSLRAGQTWRAAGFALMGAAALCGALKYAGASGIDTAHTALSQWSSRLSLLLIAIGVLRSRWWHLPVAAAAAALLLLPAAIVLVGNVLALLAIAYPGRSARWAWAIAGALLFMAAGLLVGTQGGWLGVPRVDVFHLTLAAAVLVWIAARLSEPRRRPALDLPVGLP